ncbi:MAG: carbohydrate ABC transporter permease [Anaerolineae bacterium]|nr:carbohydrate ABC transporter permease [Anaerolineae bacterium]
MGVITQLVLWVGAIIMVFPFVWMALSAFKRPDEIIAYPPIWIPRDPSFDLLRRIWTEIDFDRYFANSLFQATTVTVVVLLTSAFVGYVLAKFEFWGRDVLFLMILSTMMVPWPVLLIPQYLIVVKLKIINSMWALIAPAIYSSFGIFLMRQFMHSIPDELLDAARIDGASELKIFVRIVFPLTGPALAALGIFTFMWNWDSFIWPLVVISTQKLYTLPLGLATFTNQYWTDYAAVNAGAFISVIPVLIVFLLLQRYFIEGIALTGMKA